MLWLLLSFAFTADSGEDLFERAMSLESGEARAVFQMSADQFLQASVENTDPNLLFNAGLAFAKAGDRALAKKFLLRSTARGASPEAWRALQLVRENDGPNSVLTPAPWFAPLAQVGTALSTAVPWAAQLVGVLFTLGGCFWGFRRTGLAGLCLAAAIGLAIPLGSRTLPISGAVSADALSPREGPGNGYAESSAVLKSGDEVRIVRTVGQWCELDLPGADWRTGWVRTESLLFVEDLNRP